MMNTIAAHTSSQIATPERVGGIARAGLPGSFDDAEGNATTLLTV
jgi:hypothetical protein